PSRPDREPFWIGPRVGWIERQVRIEGERAVHVYLGDASKLGKVVPEPELHVVVAFLAREIPRVVVFDLIVRIPRSLRFSACLRPKALIDELRRTKGLIAEGLLPEDEPFPSAVGTLRAETRVAVPPVLPRPRHADRIDPRV